MRIFGLMVAKDECHRYLRASLAWNHPFVDGLLVYDDGSQDEILKAVEGAKGPHYTKRPVSVPTFLEHEGRFRQDALDAMEDLFTPEEGDWIFVIDADEFVVVDGGHTQVLREVALAAERSGCASVKMRVPEMWGVDPAVERVDGFWGSITAVRFYRWQPGGKVEDKAMGCSPVPTYVRDSKTYEKAKNVRLLHFGYADPTDREDKYKRYSRLSSNGHNSAHIESILKNPHLKQYRGELPTVWRGIRGD